MWATQNPAGLSTDALVRYPFDLSAPEVTLTVTGEVVSIQSIGVTSGGDAFISYDAPGMVGGIIYRDNLAINPMNGSLGMGDRVITRQATGLIAPKGVEAAGPTGTFIVADTGAADFKVFDFDDVGNVARSLSSPISAARPRCGTSTTSPTPTPCTPPAPTARSRSTRTSRTRWGRPTAAPIIPGDTGVKVGVNLHGITVDSNTLYLHDVGDAMNATDGQLFVIETANTAVGLKQVKQRIQGGQLGNPVDLELHQGLTTNIYVAEKSNDAVMYIFKVTPAT